MKFLYDNLSLNEKKHLAIGGVDVTYLKEKYGSPLYIMDEDLIRSNIREYKNALEKYYDGNGMVLYASKAFSCKYIYKVAKEEGAGVDVVSGGELYTALMAGFPSEKIYFHGNNKTLSELELAVSNNVGHIVIDNLYELERLNKICEKVNKVQKILFRIVQLIMKQKDYVEKIVLNMNYAKHIKGLLKKVLILIVEHLTFLKKM